MSAWKTMELKTPADIAAMYESPEARLGIIVAHLGWLRIYAHNATEEDWRDQMLLIQRQTDWCMEEVAKLRELLSPAPPLPGESNARFIAGPATPSKR